MILDATGSAIYNTLQGTALTSLLPGTASIYHMQAPDNATLPYVVFSHQGGFVENVDANDLEQNIWYVRVYSAMSAGTAAEIFHQADLLLDEKAITITGYNTLSCWREDNVTILENTPSGKIWSAGALYRIRTA